jgi:hypothetical protein
LGQAASGALRSARAARRAAVCRAAPLRRVASARVPFALGALAALAVAAGILALLPDARPPAGDLASAPPASVGQAAFVPPPALPVVAAAPAPDAARVMLRVNSHPWSRIEIDGVGIGSTPFSVELAPGPHRFRVAMSDGRMLEEVVNVTPESARVSFR